MFISFETFTSGEIIFKFYSLFYLIVNSFFFHLFNVKLFFDL